MVCVSYSTGSVKANGYLTLRRGLDARQLRGDKDIIVARAYENPRK